MAAKLPAISSGWHPTLPVTEPPSTSSDACQCSIKTSRSRLYTDARLKPHDPGYTATGARHEAITVEIITRNNMRNNSILNRNPPRYTVANTVSFRNNPAPRSTAHMQLPPPLTLSVSLNRLNSSLLNLQLYYKNNRVPGYTRTIIDVDQSKVGKHSIK